MRFTFIVLLNGRYYYEIEVIFFIHYFCFLNLDEDGDEISIIDDDDLRILADRHKDTPIKLNVRPLEKENKTTTSEQVTAKKVDESANAGFRKFTLTMLDNF